MRILLYCYRAEFTNARNFLLLLVVEVTLQFSLLFEGFSRNVRTLSAPYSKTTPPNYPFYRKKQDKRTNSTVQGDHDSNHTIPTRFRLANSQVLLIMKLFNLIFLNLIKSINLNTFSITFVKKLKVFWKSVVVKRVGVNVYIIKQLKSVSARIAGRVSFITLVQPQLIHIYWKYQQKLDLLTSNWISTFHYFSFCDHLKPIIFYSWCNQFNIIYL